jgi:two-component system chemotaxis response regulator CheY
MAQMATKTVQILLAESHQPEADAIMKMLDQAGHDQFRISRVNTLASALNSLAAQQWDILLLNLTLSDASGMNVLEKVLNLNRDLPVIVISTSEDNHYEMMTIEAGAQSYMNKSQWGVRTFHHEILASIARSRLLKSRGATTNENAVANFAEDISNNLKSPIDEIKNHLDKLKKVLTSPQFDHQVAIDLVEDAEKTAKTFQEIVSELREFSNTGTNKLKIQAQSSMHLLVVDDEADITNMLLRRLKKLGFENVDSAANGQEAYNKCVERLNNGTRYNAIISDWNMPKVTGVELLKKIRENAILKDTPFMMLTAVDEMNLIKEAIALKVSQYLVKPFKTDEFDRKVGYMLRKA